MYCPDCNGQIKSFHEYCPKCSADLNQVKELNRNNDKNSGIISK